MNTPDAYQVRWIGVNGWSKWYECSQELYVAITNKTFPEWETYEARALLVAAPAKEGK